MGSTGIAVREDDWKIVTDLVLDGISSPHTRRAYSQALRLVQCHCDAQATLIRNAITDSHAGFLE
jgi:hypothetical protein